MPYEILSDPQEFGRKMLLALCFEQYLRFFYLDIPDDAPANAPAILNVPNEVINEIQEKNPLLMPLIEALQGKAITFEQSRSAVVQQTAHLMGVTPCDKKYLQMAAEISVSDFFQDELLAFHGWVQTMDEMQDATECIPFHDWLAAYSSWREKQDI